MDHKGTPWSIEGHCGYLPGYVDDRAFTNFSENVVGFLFSSVFRGKITFIFCSYFIRSAPNTMTKAVDAFSKYFLYLNVSTVQEQFQHLPFPFSLVTLD